MIPDTVEKIRVFVSSVINKEVDDLEAERAIIIDTIQEYRATSPWGFEYMPASDMSAEEFCLRGVRDCHLFFLLLGKQVTNPVIKEYEEASQRRKPLFVFIRGNERMPCAEELYQRIKGKSKYANFNDKKELPVLVANTLTGFLRRLVEDYQTQLKEFTVFKPLIDEKTRDFVGREFVIAELDTFLKKNDRGYFVIQGEPGIGKTSLLAYLAKKHQYIYHFNDELLGIVETEHFLESVCRQLITRYQPGRQYDTDKDFRDGRYLYQLLEDISNNLPEGERIVILIDALDEAKMIPGSGNNALCLPYHLPSRVYIVCTTRPSGSTRLFVYCPRKDFILKSDSQHNLADVRCFIKNSLSPESLSKNIQTVQLTGNQFIEILVRKSEGNFMYLYYVLPEIESGTMKADDLPQGLVGYYERHWQKMKSSDLNQWVELQQPVICVLASVQEPVTVKQVADFTHGLTPAKVAAVVNDWRQFLTESLVDGEKRYRLYHTSFQDFLKKKDEVGEVDLKQTHRNISEVLKSWLYPDIRTR